jgi:transposase
MIKYRKIIYSKSLIKRWILALSIKLLEDSYNKKMGRPAKEPEMMAKLLILQYLYNLSDVKIIEEVH